MSNLLFVYAVRVLVIVVLVLGLAYCLPLRPPIILVVVFWGMCAAIVRRVLGTRVYCLPMAAVGMVFGALAGLFPGNPVTSFFTTNPALANFGGGATGIESSGSILGVMVSAVAGGMLAGLPTHLMKIGVCNCATVHADPYQNGRNQRNCGESRNCGNVILSVSPSDDPCRIACLREHR